MTRKLLITVAAFGIFLSVPAVSFGAEDVTAVKSASAETKPLPGRSIRELVGERIYNEQGATIGRVRDVIVAPDGWVSYAVISAGAYLQLKKNDVALPVKLFVEQDGRFIVPGATERALRSAPAFK